MPAPVLFYSSVELGAFMTALVEELAALGIRAEHRFFVSTAACVRARSRPGRIFLRFLQYVLYPLWLTGSLLFGKARRAGTLVVCTNTFYAPLIATLLHKRVIHLVYDVFPEAFWSDECRVSSDECVARRTPPGRFVSFRGGPRRSRVRTSESESAELKRRGGLAAVRDRICRCIVRTTLRRAGANVFLGDHLRDYIISQYPDVRNPVVIPVGAMDMWSDECRVTSDECRVTSDKSKSSELPAPVSAVPAGPSTTFNLPNLQPSKPFTILYCGNLGRMHDIDTLLDALASDETSEFRVNEDSESRVHAASQRTVHGPGCGASAEACRVKPPEGGTPNLFFTFHCHGPKKAGLESSVAALPPEIRTRIHIGGPLSSDDWRRVMHEADIALVTMIPGAENVVMPSKTYSAMMAGQALLAICPEESDLADTVRRSDCGWVVAPGDSTALLRALHEAQTDPGSLHRKRQNARAWALANASMPVLARRWEELFKA